MLKIKIHTKKDNEKIPNKIPEGRNSDEREV